jgi:prepilin-type N-terminal cleavage/methylation domain-containing protein
MESAYGNYCGFCRFMKNALQSKSHRAGFTLVEIMIVVAIIALLAAIAVPSLQRARKRTQATRILEDLRVLEYALDRWSIEKNKTIGDVATIADLRPYLKINSQLYATGADLFGNPYGPDFPVDYMPQVADATYDALSDVAPAEFWSPYK